MDNIKCAVFRCYRDLVIQGHWKCTIQQIVYDFLFMFASDNGSTMYHLTYLILKKTLQLWNPGQWSLKVIKTGSIQLLAYRGFLLASYSNFVSKLHRFWAIRLEKYRNLEIRVRGHSRSLEMTPFERSHMTSYLTFHSNFGASLYHERYSTI